MGGYVDYFNHFVDTINELPNRLAAVVVSSIREPIESLTNTLLVTNILLGLLVVTSIANVYMLWKNGKR